MALAMSLRWHHQLLQKLPIKGIALDGPNKAFEAPRDHAANPSAKTPKLLLLPGFLILIRASLKPE
jgi:hypothetical protein